MELSSSGLRRRAAAPAVLMIAALALFGVLAPADAASTAPRVPNLAAGSAYLVAPANLIDGHYFESYPGVADFGLTIDGALALAATGDENPALRKIVAFIDGDGKDPSGDTINEWTGIGTPSVSGGAIGKEALLAEVVGDNPRSFAGHNLIVALDATVCQRVSGGATPVCPATGSYRNATSVFDQALGIMAQIRAGQTSQAAAPIAYLESLQAADGSFPSLVPAGGGPDVDSTAMAVMALGLAPGRRAAADVASGVSWIASQQQRNGGFPSAGAESVNTTGLAIQALTLRAPAYRTRISAALAFLAAEQNSDGGFNIDAGGQPGSNVRASTQSVGGAVGTSFGTLSRDLNSPAAKAGAASSPASWVWLALAAVVVIAAVILAVLVGRRRRSPPPPARTEPAASPPVRQVRS
jgi:Prenyltransferase and squalene oxidase repeat